MAKQKTKNEELGHRIRELRKWLRISQLSLAEFLKIPRTAISALESGVREVSGQEVVRLSTLFRSDPNSILGLTPTAVDYSGLKFKTRENHAGKPLDEHDLKELAKFGEFLSSKNSAPKLRSPQELVTSKVPQKAAEEFRSKLKITCPVDIYSVIETIGLYPRFTSLIGLAGAIVRSNSNENSFGILVNSDQPEERTRFSAAHEVAHYVLQHLHQDEEYHSSPKARWRSPIESDADSFAAELLVPKSDLAKKVRDIGFVTSLQAQELADTFLVSYQAMLNRLLEHHHISKVQYDSYSKEKPSELRVSNQKKNSQKKSYPFNVKSLESWVTEKINNSADQEFVNSPDWVRFIQETACYKYWEAHPFNERATEVKDVYEKVAFWIAEYHPPKLR